MGSESKISMLLIGNVLFLYEEIYLEATNLLISIKNR